MTVIKAASYLREIERQEVIIMKMVSITSGAPPINGSKTGWLQKELSFFHLLELSLHYISVNTERKQHLIQK